MGVSRLHLKAWNWFLKELVVIEPVGFSCRKWNAGICYRVYKNPTITDPCSESSKSNPHIPILCIQDQYDILPSTSRVFLVISYLRVFYSKFVFISYIFHTWCMSHACHLLHHLTARVICGEEHSFFTAHCTCLSRQPYSWLPKNIFQSGIFLCWPHFFSSKLALNVH